MPWSGRSIPRRISESHVLRAASAMLAGAASAAAFAPVHAVPVLWVSFPILAWLISTGGLRRAFWTGWAFGFGQFAAGLYWIGASFVYTGQFGWIAGGIGVAGLSAGLAVFPASAALVAWTFDSLPRRLIALGAAWVLAEGLRSWLLTGFPWNLTGQVWAFSVETLQPAAWIGTHGLGAVTVFAALAPAALASRRLRLGLLLPAPLAAVLFLGLLRDNVRTLDLGEGPVVRIVQGNVPQAARLDAARFDDNLRQYVVTSLTPPAEPPPKLVIWPEAVVPFDPTGREDVRRNVRDVQAAIPGEVRLATGGFRIRPADGAVFNSLFFLAPDGQVEAYYDKVHLVPFGEFLPLAGWLPDFLRPVTGRGMQAAEGRARVSIPGFPLVAPAICYEIIFPTSTGGPERPAWLLNVTNDAWFGRTSGPFQHFAQARLRAVEEGLPVIRAANTGISAVIDARGRVLARLALGQRGVIDHPLPVPEKPPLHARTGDVPLFGALFALLVLMLATIRRKPAADDAAKD